MNAMSVGLNVHVLTQSFVAPCSTLIEARTRRSPRPMWIWRKILSYCEPGALKSKKCCRPRAGPFARAVVVQPRIDRDPGVRILVPRDPDDDLLIGGRRVHPDQLVVLDEDGVDASGAAALECLEARRLIAVRVIRRASARSEHGQERECHRVTEWEIHHGRGASTSLRHPRRLAADVQRMAGSVHSRPTLAILKRRLARPPLERSRERPLVREPHARRDLVDRDLPVGQKAARELETAFVHDT